MAPTKKGPLLPPPPAAETGLILQGRAWPFRSSRLRVLWLPVSPSPSMGSLRAVWARLSFQPGQHTMGQVPGELLALHPLPVRPL